MAFRGFLSLIRGKGSEAKSEIELEVIKPEAKPAVEPSLPEIRLDSLKRDIAITDEGLRKLEEGQEASKDEKYHMEHFPRYLNQLKNLLQEIKPKENGVLTEKSKAVLDKALQIEQKLIVLKLVIEDIFKQKLRIPNINSTSDVIRLTWSVEPDGNHYQASVFSKKILSLQENERKLNSTRTIWASFRVEQHEQDYYRSHGRIARVEYDVPNQEESPEPPSPTNTGISSSMFHTPSIAPLLQEEPKKSSGIRRSRSF